MEKWFSFFCPCPGNRPQQSCGPVLSWGLGAVPLPIPLGMNSNFSQAEFVSPRTVVGKQCSCLYLHPWTFWSYLLWEPDWAACLSSLSHCCFKATPNTQRKKCQELQINQSKKFQIIAPWTGRQWLCGEGNVCPGKRTKPRGNGWGFLCLPLVTCIAVRKWEQAEVKMWDAFSFLNQQGFLPVFLQNCVQHLETAQIRAVWHC